ncbi:MAG TPA: hypothetical protein DHU96_15360 [Actinobacteria bacterium]|nr:hypothetical protein [Actinomycetota bacterium]
MSQRAGQQGRRIQFTGRGATVIMFAVFIAGLLGATWLGWQVLAGGAFLAGSVAAACYTRQRDLLTVAVTPPLLFCIALVGVKTLTATGNAAVAIAGGTALTLAGAAPWLLAGTALNLVIACIRGLPRCVGELRRDLQPDQRRPDPGRRAATGTRPGDAASTLDNTHRG